MIHYVNCAHAISTIGRVHLRLASAIIAQGEDPTSNAVLYLDKQGSGDLIIIEMDDPFAGEGPQFHAICKFIHGLKGQCEFDFPENTPSLASQIRSESPICSSPVS